MIENTFGKNIIPDNDAARLEALKRYRIMDSPSEDSFDNIAKLATEIFNVPISLISLVDTDRVFFKANVGMGKARETNRGKSLCALAVLDPKITVFEDALKEPCLIANPNVAGNFGLRFYAGAPLITHDGFLIGTLCIIDKQPRSFSEREESILKKLAIGVMDQVELRLSAIMEFEKLQSVNEELRSQQEEMSAINEELSAANEELNSSQENLINLNDELVMSESRFRSLIAQSPVAIGTLKGRELVIETVNEMILEIWGKGQAIIGMPLAAALPELEGQPFLQMLDKVYTSGQPFFGNEFKALLVNHGVPRDRFLNFVYQPIKGPDGSTREIMVVAIDVTEQVDARKAAEEANERLGIALDAGELGSYDVDLNTGVMICTEQCKRNFGLPPDAIFNFPDLFNYILPEYHEEVKGKIDSSLINHTIYHAEYRVLWPDGTFHWISAQGKPRYDEGGQAYRMVGVTSEITERKKDDQRKGDFIGMVSHELKTPLTSLKGFVQILQSRAAKNEDIFAAGLLDKAGKQLGKMTHLVTGFLDVSRYDAGKIAINKQPFDLAELIKEIEEETLATVTSHEVIFAPVEFTPVYADRDKIGQVVTNLISNAVKYSPPSSLINVACVTIDNVARVSVKDRGMGIAENNLQKLFERYYRVEGEQTSSISGFGIGLYLCHEIIERHHGKIWVESEQGKGSIFWFTLPLAL